MSSDTELVNSADAAYEAIRTLNHGTYRTIPAPLAYSLLGNLAGAGHGLAQLLGQINTGLSKSLTEYDVYDRNRDPAESVDMTAEALDSAAELAAQLGELLSTAQGAINLQGYNLPTDQVGHRDTEE